MKRGDVHEDPDLFPFYQQGSHLSGTIFGSVSAVVDAKAGNLEGVFTGRCTQGDGFAYIHAKQFPGIWRQDGRIIRLDTGICREIAHDVRAEGFLNATQGGLDAVDLIRPALVHIHHIVPGCSCHITSGPDLPSPLFRQILNGNVPEPVVFLGVLRFTPNHQIHHTEDGSDQKYGEDNAQQRHAVLPPVDLGGNGDQAKITSHWSCLPSPSGHRPIPETPGPQRRSDCCYE